MAIEYLPRTSLVYICFSVSLSPQPPLTLKRIPIWSVTHMVLLLTIPSRLRLEEKCSMFLFRWYHHTCPPGSALVSGLHSSAREEFFFLLADCKKKRREANLWVSVRRRQLGRKLSVALQKLGSQK